MKTIGSLLLFILLVASAGSARAQLPKVTLKDINGRIVTTDTLANAGKPFIVSFFATWCKPCLRELAAIHDVYPDWQEETGVRLVAVSIDEAQNAQKVRPLVEGNAWDYEVLLDTNSELRRVMGVNLIPHVFIVDGSGRIVFSRSGYAEGSEDELFEKVRALKKE